MDHLWLIFQATFVVICVLCAIAMSIYVIAVIVSAAGQARAKRRNWRV